MNYLLYFTLIKLLYKLITNEMKFSHINALEILFSGVGAVKHE